MNEKKLIESFSIIMKEINQLDQEVTEFQEKIYLNIINNNEYINLQNKYNKIQIKIHKLQEFCNPVNNYIYILFLELKMYFNTLKNKVENTKYMMIIFEQLNKKTS